jgi:hypothetical protein
VPVYRDLFTRNDVIHVSLILLCVFSFFQQSNNNNSNSDNNMQLVPPDYRFDGSPRRFQTQMVAAPTNTLSNQHYGGRTDNHTSESRETVTSEYPSDEETTERGMVTNTRHTPYNQSMGLSGSNANVTRVIEGSDGEDMDAFATRFARSTLGDVTAR